MCDTIEYKGNLFRVLHWIQFYPEYPQEDLKSRNTYYTFTRLSSKWDELEMDEYEREYARIVWCVYCLSGQFEPVEGETKTFAPAEDSIPLNDGKGKYKKNFPFK